MGQFLKDKRKRRNPRQQLARSCASLEGEAFSSTVLYSNIIMPVILPKAVASSCFISKITRGARSKKDQCFAVSALCTLSFGLSDVL